ncbi:hypothetical protein M569_04277, partial [Genlisea aurea]
SRKVAVIGAGAAGLCAALELRREGHRVVVYERENRSGGTWVYTPEVESDEIGSDPNRRVIHSSLYASLRTNLPREVMGFRTYPFVESGKPWRDSRRFPGHAEVLAYLTDFSDEFQIGEMVRYGTEIRRLILADDRKWIVEINGEEDKEEAYDAVVVCNGHYTHPRIADITGIDEWPGKQIHSHNYRTPDIFHDQVVVLIGSAASATDISREIAGVSKEVHLAIRSNEDALRKMPSPGNIHIHPMIETAHRDGRITFEDGEVVRADAILHCTGYKYHFPFLESTGIVSVEDNRVHPLYKHVFPPDLAPRLSFVGIPWKVVPLPLIEYQSKWIAGALSGRITLPTPQQMLSDIEAFYASMEQSGIPKRYTHRLGTDQQFEYNDWLAEQVGSAPTEEWRKKMYLATGQRIRKSPETYRDEWDEDDQELISLAHNDFLQ